MKIFKHGPEYEDKLYTCKNCQCEFETDYTDELYSCFDDYNNAYTFYVCPDCGCEVITWRE